MLRRGQQSRGDKSSLNTFSELSPYISRPFSYAYPTNCYVILSNFISIFTSNRVISPLDRCLSVMSSAIPPRLSVPILLEGASSILCLGHRVAEKFSTLLGKYDTATVYMSISVPCVSHMQLKEVIELTTRNYRTGNVWGNLDRPTVLQHVAPLSSLATLILDYRRAYGDQTEATAEVCLSQLHFLNPE